MDGDGWPDIIVANDTVRNFFFHNKGNGTFEEIGLMSGWPSPRERRAEPWASTGGEYRPGRFGLLLANFADEPTPSSPGPTRKQLLFSDAAMAEGVGGPSRSLLKFGTFFFDYDLDGRLDLLTCNGHLEPDISKVQAGQTYEQPVQLFWNTGGKATFVAGDGDARPGPICFGRWSAAAVPSPISMATAIWTWS